MTSLRAITAIDGRYAAQTEPFADYFSEYALMRFRVHIEIEWLLALSQADEIGEVRAFTSEETTLLRRLAANFSDADATAVKEIERTTNHDVKAIEYWIKNQLETMTLADVREWVHFACTSEDINNLAHALMLKNGIERGFLRLAHEVVEAVATLARDYADTAMLARTHGQPASPTTVGKEMAVFVHRWRRQLQQIETQEYLGKINGAVGNWNAHIIAYPNVDWPALAERFVTGLGLTYNPVTTQIESHDYMAELFHALIRFNNILLDFDRDLWTYISLGYFKQKTVAGEVGSSTMPHKVNPIDFENAEANIGIANALLEHLASKLAVSRLQRDLSDSSALRNMGTGIVHACLALQATLRGLKKLTVNTSTLDADLNQTWEVLGEAVQTVMRKENIANPYEKLKELTRGAGIGPESLRVFIESLDLPEPEKARLLALTPGTYIGIAPQIARETAGA